MKHILVILLVVTIFTTYGYAQTSKEDPRKALNEILEAPAYQRWKLRQTREQAEASSEWNSSILDGINEYINDLMAWLRERESTPSPSSSDFSASSLGEVLTSVGYVFLVLIILFIAIVVIRNLYIRRGGTMGARVLSRTQVNKALESGEALALSSDAWLQEAQRLVGEKQFRAVYRALYLALLSGLHSAGKIDFRTNRTNWVYVSRYRGQKEERTVFSDLTALFDSVWYGLKAPADASMNVLRNQVKKLLQSGAPNVK